MNNKLRFSAFVWAALALAFGSAVAAPVCYNPLTQTIPGVTVTASGACNVSIPPTLNPPIPGYNPAGFVLPGDGSSCKLSFSTPVKNVTVDVGAHSCDAADGNFLTCQTALFNVNGVHRPIASGELITPTNYSLLAGQQGLDPVAPLSLDSNGNVVGGNDPVSYNGNGSGQVVLPSAMAVRSISIQTTSDQSLAYTSDNSWFNVCYDGLAPATVTVNKVSKGGTGSFSFKGTANANGFSTDGSYTVTTSSQGVAASGSLVNLTATNTLTEIQETLPAGWALTGASCVDANAAVSGGITSTLGTMIGNTLQIPASAVLAGAALQCTFTNTYGGLALSGRVIIDTGVGSGTAHDGIQNGAEPGQPGVTVNLTDCGSTVYSSTTSAGDGSFTLSLTGAPSGVQACVVQVVPPSFSAVSANVGTTAGSYSATTATLKFTPASNTGYSGIVLGNVPMSTFTADGAQQTSPGQAVVYAHSYVAATAGSVSFSTTNSPTPAGLIWTSTLFLDPNCHGVLDGTEALLTGPVSVIAGQQVCVLNKVMTPAGAANGAQDVTVVSASELWTVLSPSGTQSRVLKDTDITNVGASGLSLIKEVRKTVTCPADAATSLGNTSAYAVSGIAKPGDLLEYRLRYTNSTAAPMTAIVLHDQVPTYTRFQSALCLSTPPVGNSGCSVSQQPALNATTGALAWTLSDSSSSPIGLQPLGAGAVSFCVQVQQ